MTDTTFIYVLKDPGTGEVRYVGKAHDPKTRLRWHLSEKGDTHKINWIKSLKVDGKAPLLEVIDEVPIEYWQQWEAAWIYFFRETGTRLTNATSGGDGVEMTEETLAKKSTSIMGEKHPMFGKTFSAEARKNMSEAKTGERNHNFGKITPLKTREKIAAAQRGEKSYNFGKALPPKTREKMAAAKRGENNPMFGKSGDKSPTFGKSHSPETCAKISMAMLGRIPWNKGKKKL